MSYEIKQEVPKVSWIQIVESFSKTVICVTDTVEKAKRIRTALFLADKSNGIGFWAIPTKPKLK